MQGLPDAAEVGAGAWAWSALPPWRGFSDRLSPELGGGRLSPELQLLHLSLSLKRTQGHPSCCQQNDWLRPVNIADFP